MFNESGRISKNKGRIKIKVPFGVNWVRDVDHEGGFDFLSLSGWQNQNWRVGGKNFCFRVRSMKGKPTIFGKFIPNIPTPFKLKKQNAKFRCGLRDILSLFVNFVYINLYVELEVIKKEK
mgnify:CR=1 FL=1